MNTKDTKRSAYVAPPSKETMNLYPRDPVSKRNEYQWHDELRCKVYDDDLRVIEFSCDL